MYQVPPNPLGLCLPLTLSRSLGADYQGAESQHGECLVGGGLTGIESLLPGTRFHLKGPQPGFHVSKGFLLSLPHNRC